MDKNISQKILTKEVTRSEFLKMGGLLIIGIVGLPQLMSMIHHMLANQPPSARQELSRSGYGARPYGS